MQNWTVTNFQSCEGPEGLAYSCNIHIDGKRVGSAHYAGNGGCIETHWTDANAGKAFMDDSVVLHKKIYGEKTQVIDAETVLVTRLLSRMA